MTPYNHNHNNNNNIVDISASLGPHVFVPIDKNFIQQNLFERKNIVKNNNSNNNNNDPRRPPKRRLLDRLRRNHNKEELYQIININGKKFYLNDDSELKPLIN